MKHWLDENLEPLLVISVILLLIAIVVYLVLDEEQDEQICQDAGYIGQAVVGNQVVCYGFEGDQIIVANFEDVRAE